MFYGAGRQVGFGVDEQRLVFYLAQIGGGRRNADGALRPHPESGLLGPGQHEGRQGGKADAAKETEQEGPHAERFAVGVVQCLSAGSDRIVRLKEVAPLSMAVRIEGQRGELPVVVCSRLGVTQRVIRRIDPCRERNSALVLGWYPIRVK
jgi:hypothetical protein